jgi:hypothetical protein
VVLIRASVEHLPFPDAVFDTVGNDLEVVLDPESDRGAVRDAAGSQTGRAVTFRRARPVAGNHDCSLAAMG